MSERSYSGLNPLYPQTGLQYMYLSSGSLSENVVTNDMRRGTQADGLIRDQDT